MLLMSRLGEMARKNYYNYSLIRRKRQRTLRFSSYAAPKEKEFRMVVRKYTEQN